MATTVIKSNGVRLNFMHLHRKANLFAGVDVISTDTFVQLCHCMAVANTKCEIID